jgi:hypothetical protein
VYFFDVYNDDITLDDEGIELADEQAANARGIKEVRALASDTVRHGHLVRHHYVEIRDANHNAVGAVRFDEAVDIRD